MYILMAKHLLMKFPWCDLITKIVFFCFEHNSTWQFYWFSGLSSSSQMNIYGQMIFLEGKILELYRREGTKCIFYKPRNLKWLYREYRSTEKKQTPALILLNNNFNKNIKRSPQKSFNNRETYSAVFCSIQQGLEIPSSLLCNSNNQLFS